MPPADETRLPAISIVTPSFNQAKYIARAIESVRGQDYPALEHLVVDGGSTDGTLSVLESYEGPANFRWTSAPDAGQSHAINKGMRLASGKIAGWLNSDDELFPGALLGIGEAFLEHPDAALVYGSGAKIDEEGRELKRIPFRPLDRKRLRSALYFLQPSMYFSREAFLAAGELNEYFHYAMDWDLLLRFGPDAEFIAIDQPIGKLRCYPGTKTETGGWARNREIANIARRAHGSLDGNYLSLCVRERVARLGAGAAGVLARKLTDAILPRMLGAGRCMVEGWPDEI